jgi:pimeloyl-ACP methyl ester carboxylesterase
MSTQVFYENIDGYNIFCHVTKSTVPSKKLIIMCHGFRGSSIGPVRTFVDFAKILVNSGYNVLRFDQFGCGNSG